MSLDLTKQEQTNVRAALQFLRKRMGGWEYLAKALGFNERSLSSMGRDKKPSEKAVFRVARFVGVSIDDLLAGQYPAPGACPYCGHVAEGSVDAATTGE